MTVDRASCDESFDPVTGRSTGSVPHSSPEEVLATLRGATEATGVMRSVSPATRARWIGSVVDALLQAEDELVSLAQAETALGEIRLRGELRGLAANARFYASAAVEGSYLGVSQDSSGAARLHRWNVPLGVVAVFGASNFPFGFGAFGHDVASALAAGCPVVVKAHPAHPRLSVAIADIANRGLLEAGAPAGAYGMVVGFDAGLDVVDSPAIAAVAFTGSQTGGMSLVQRAAARGVPVFAEMGTVNPVLVIPGVSDRREIADGFVASFTMGSGQFCTKPGLILVPEGEGYPELIRSALSAVEAVPLLTAAIAERFREGVSQRGSHALSPRSPAATTGGWAVEPVIITASVDELTEGSPLLEECFGPVAVVAEYPSAESARAALRRLQPSLAASIFTGGETHEYVTQALDVLLAKVGRVAINMWPTGVTVAWSQQHGGPWPATSRPDATSVGAHALDRFVRPVTLQNAADAELPEFVRSANPWRLRIRIDGELHHPLVTPKGAAR